MPNHSNRNKKPDRITDFENDNTLKDEFQDDVKEDDISILNTDKAAKKEAEYKEEKEVEYGYHRNTGVDDVVAKNDKEDATTNVRTSDIDRFWAKKKKQGNLTRS